MGFSYFLSPNQQACPMRPNKVETYHIPLVRKYKGTTFVRKRAQILTFSLPLIKRHGEGEAGMEIPF